MYTVTISRPNAPIERKGAETAVICAYQRLGMNAQDVHGIAAHAKILERRGMLKLEHLGATAVIEIGASE